MTTPPEDADTDDIIVESPTSSNDRKTYFTDSKIIVPDSNEVSFHKDI